MRAAIRTRRAISRPGALPTASFRYNAVMDEMPSVAKDSAPRACISATVRRPWFRLHLSTCVVLLFALAGAALLNIPGEEVERWGKFGWSKLDDVYVAHGWPATFLRRARLPNATQAALAWHLTQGVEELRIGALLLDFCVAAAGIALLAIVLERRRRRRPFFQFRLRTLLVGVVLVAVGLDWWRSQRYADTELRGRIGAFVDFGGDPLFPEAERVVPRFPLWVRALVGDERLIRTGVTKPNCIGVDWTRKDHANIKYLVDRFPERIVVGLQGDESDADLDLFCELTNLENLDISDPDERILSRLGRFKKLRFLMPGVRPHFMGTYFWKNPITDRGLAYLANLTQLEALELDEGQFTDCGLVGLRNLTSLESLRIMSRHVTDAGLKNLAGMRGLRQLSLSFSPITDAGLLPLAGFKHLQRLDLSGTSISDEGLPLLVGFSNLKDLQLRATGVTDAGVAALKKSHPNPNLQVDYESESIDLGHLAADIAEARTTDVLNVMSRKVRDGDLSGLGRLTNLRVLSLWSPFISDATLARLEPLSQLSELYLTCGRITPRGVDHLARLPNLQMLSLPASQISDEMIDSLKRLKSLRTLDITDVDDPDATKLLDAKLKNALPRCEIKNY